MSVLLDMLIYEPKRWIVSRFMFLTVTYDLHTFDLYEPKGIRLLGQQKIYKQYDGN